MFRSLTMGRTPDVFNLSFGYREEVSVTTTTSNTSASVQQEVKEEEGEEMTKTEMQFHEVNVEYNSERDHEEILDKIADGQMSLPFKEQGDVVKAQLLCLQGGYDVVKVKVRLTIEPYKPTPKVFRLTRQNNTGTATLCEGLYSLLKGCDLDSIEELVLGEGVVRILGDIRERFKNVVSIDLSNAQLTELPVEITQFFPRLEVLKLNDNKLNDLPSLVNLKSLRELHCDNNQLTKIRTDLRENKMLRIISFKGNKLTKPVMDMKALSKVHTFHLYGNPVEYLPEMHHCKSLRCLSLVNVVVSANDDLTDVDVQVGDTTSSYIPQAISGKAAQKGKAFSAFFTLVFRHSSCQHLLIATALAKIAQEDPSNCVEIAATEGALQQMLTMLLTSDENVIREATHIIAAMSQLPDIAQKLIDSKVSQRIQSLMADSNYAVQICGCNILASLAFASGKLSKSIYDETLISLLIDIIKSDNSELKSSGLLALGNLGFESVNRRAMLKMRGIRSLLAELALSFPENENTELIKKYATRALAIFGENEIVRQAINRRPIVGKGVRILCMDGGGMRGISTVQMLRRIEEGTGKPIHELFDLICGTSTGGILACAVGVRKHDLTRCDEIYTDLGTRIFSKPKDRQDGEASWKDRFDNLYRDGQQKWRVAVHGSKHDANVFESLLQQESEIDGKQEPFIETSLRGGPKVFVVGTIVSKYPSSPYVFRNYQYPETVEDENHGRYAMPGSCKHLMWHCLRASSAAPYYLADFTLGDEKWQDGAVTCNNPAMMGIMEARRLWPDRQIECVVSLGTGEVPRVKRKDASIHSLIDASAIMLESSCNVERVDEALGTLLPLIPETKYFRFNPIDLRCDIDLDEIDKQALKRLREATDEYVKSENERFGELCQLLQPDALDEETAAVIATELGSKKGVLVIEAQRYENEFAAKTEIVEEFCALRSIPFARIDTSSSYNPENNGFFFGKNGAASENKNNDNIHAGAKENAIGGKNGSIRSDRNKMGGEQELVDANNIAIENLNAQFKRIGANAGVIHLNCVSDLEGIVLRWQHDITAIAEPSAVANLFIECAKYPSKQSQKFTSLYEMCSSVPSVEVEGVLHTFIGKHLQSDSNDGQLGAYLFKRTIPLEYLSDYTANKLIGMWNDKIIVSQASISADLVEALLDAGAKAIVAPTNEDPDNFITAGAEGDDIFQFFAAFYHALYVVGADAPAATSAACMIQPSCNYFRCHVRVRGSTVELKPGEEVRKTGTPKKASAQSLEVQN